MKSRSFRPKLHAMSFMEQKPARISSLWKVVYCVQGKSVDPQQGSRAREDVTVFIPFSFSVAVSFLIPTSLDECVPSTYFFLQSVFLCSIVSGYMAKNGCCQSHLYTLSAFLPVSIPRVAFYFSSDFQEREYDCSLACQWWAPFESRACPCQVSRSP